MPAIISAFRGPRPRGLALCTLAGLTALTLALGACDNSYGSRQFERSVLKAVPFFQALQRGEMPTEEEVKAARIGPFEPLLLAQLRMRRETDQIDSDYQARWNALAIEEMLLPEHLASASARAKSRAKLSAAATVNGDVANRYGAVLTHREREVQTLMAAAPLPQTSGGKEFTDTVERMRRRMSDIAAVREQYQAHVQQLLTLLDAHPKDVRLQRGDPPELAFRDPAIERQYNAKLDEIHDLLDRSDAMDQAFDDTQGGVNEKMKKVIKVLEQERQWQIR